MADVTNTSKNTINKNMIIPDVYAQLVREKIAGKTRVAQFCVKMGNLQGKPGETLILPAWRYVGDAKDWAVNTPMEVSAMKQATTSVTIKAVAAPGIKVADYDSEVELGNALEEAATQQAISLARKYDTDAIEACTKSPLKVQLSDKNGITVTELLDAFGLFGDDRDSADFDALVINSVLAKSLYSMDMFVRKDFSTSSENNGIAVNGVLGYFLNVPVVLSDRLYDSENQMPFGLLMKKGALAIIPKENPHTEISRDASLRQSIIYTSQFYAMGLINDNAVVVLKGQPSEAA